ncbi:unnamed protein product [Sphagnum tenellum]
MSPHSRETICEEGRIASSDQAISISLQDRSRPQQTSEEEQASLLRSDGRPRGELLPRSYPPAAPLDIATTPSESSSQEDISRSCSKMRREPKPPDV